MMSQSRNTQSPQVENWFTNSLPSRSITLNKLMLERPLRLIFGVRKRNDDDFSRDSEGM